MKDDKKKKLNKLKEMAGKVAKGAADVITGNASGGVASAMKDAAKSTRVSKEGLIAAGRRAARAMGKATVERDTAQENQVGERYKDVNPIMANGIFSSATNKNQYKNSNLTQAEGDRKEELDRKKKKR